jgi:hypothetical protein
MTLRHSDRIELLTLTYKTLNKLLIARNLEQKT